MSLVQDRFKLTSRARLEGFIEAFEEYKSNKLRDALGSETTFQLFAQEPQELELRARLYWATQLRKFVLGKRDAYYLMKVHLCIEELDSSADYVSSRKQLAVLLQNLENGNVGPITIHEGAEVDPTPDSQIVDDALNGSLLHSDPDKAKRHMARAEESVHYALFAWILRAESVCEVALGMAKKVLADLDAEMGVTS